MLALAWQNVRGQPGRFLACAGAIGSSVTLILVSAGLYLGLLDAMMRWPRTLPGEIVVVEAGSAATVLHSSSRLSRDVVRAVGAVDGVADAKPLYGKLVWLDRAGRQALVYLVGVDVRDRFGLPAALLAGRERPRLAEIVVDEVLAHDLRVGLGDRLRVGDASLTVAGIAAGGNNVIGSYAFVARDTLLLGGVQQPGYLFVTAAPDTSVEELRTRLGAIPGVTALSRDEFRAANQALTRQLVLPLITILVVVAGAISSCIVGLVLSSATLERRAEYGLLLALGVPPRQVRSVAIAQGLLAAAAGIVLGLVGGHAIAVVVRQIEPRFVTVIPAWVAALAAGGAVVVGLAATTAPVRALARLDPALVFRV